MFSLKIFIFHYKIIFYYKSKMFGDRLHVIKN